MAIGGLLMGPSLLTSQADLPDDGLTEDQLVENLFKMDEASRRFVLLALAVVMLRHHLHIVRAERASVREIRRMMIEKSEALDKQLNEVNKHLDEFPGLKKSLESVKAEYEKAKRDYNFCLYLERASMVMYLIAILYWCEPVRLFCLRLIGWH